MLTDLVVQFYDAAPRRELSVFMLLTGKKTLSVLFAALQHDQLQWLQLYPTLARADYQAAVQSLVNDGTLTRSKAGTVLAAPAARVAAAARLGLPTHYQPWLGVEAATRRLLLGIQVVSEARYANRRYRPVVSEWATQQAVRRWSRQVQPEQFVQELTAAFETLTPAVANRLAERLVGHDYVGQARGVGLAAAMQTLDDFAALLQAIAQHPEWAALNALWGGQVALLSASNRAACTLLEAGADRPGIAQRLRLKPSTVNEHLLAATIFGWQPPLTNLYSSPLKAAFDRAPAAAQDYNVLLAAVPGSDFFQVRLFQILQLQGRWPHD